MLAIIAIWLTDEQDDVAMFGLHGGHSDMDDGAGALQRCATKGNLNLIKLRTEQGSIT
jgi:hypothetical protein